jgi:hypothetical protein
MAELLLPAGGIVELPEGVTAIEVTTRCDPAPRWLIVVDSPEGDLATAAPPVRMISGERSF